ncbi:MAG TPA: VOC family protein [Cyclobacteriaceae bacterium]|nr:VOC family protein [Cyclobacteriaceae bacterium]
MKFEHFALNVAQPRAMCDWYKANLGLSVVRKAEESPFMTFLADDSGTIMLEIYNNPAAAVLEFQELHPLMVHLAFVSKDPKEDKQRLIKAGAQLVSDEVLEDGSHLVMLRDPWGLAIQLCKRAIPMLKAR